MKKITFLTITTILSAQTYILEPVNITGNQNTILSDTHEVLKAKVQLQESAPGLYNPIINGLQGDKISITIDGLRFSNAIWRSGPNQYFSWIPQEFVLDNEILPTSDAIGSTINTQLGISENSVSYKFDQYNTGSTALVKMDYGEVKAGLKYQNTGNYNELEQTDYNQNALYLEHSAKNHSSKLLYSVSRDINRPDKLIKGIPYTWNLQEYFLLKHSYSFSDSDTVDMSFQRFNEKIDNNGEKYNSDNNMYGLKYNHIFTNELNFIFSNYYEDMSHKENSYSYNTLNTGLEYHHDFEDFSVYFRYILAYANAQWDNNKRDFLSNALSLELYEDIWYTRYDYGYKFPAIQTIAYPEATEKGYDLPNTHLEQETSHTFTLGTRNEYSANVSYDVSIFYLYMDNLIDRIRVDYQIDGEDVYQISNINSGFIYGVNFETSFNIFNLKNYFSLQYAEGKTNKDYISKLTPLKLFYKAEYKDLYLKWEYAPKSYQLAKSDLADVRIEDPRYDQYHNVGYNIFSLGMKHTINRSNSIAVNLNNIFKNNGRVLGSSVDVPQQSFSVTYKYSPTI